MEDLGSRRQKAQRLIQGLTERQRLRRRPHTSSVESSTLDWGLSEPRAIDHQPSTLNHQPSTINPQTSTLNHQPSIPDSQPSTPKGAYVKHLSGRRRKAHRLVEQLAEGQRLRCRETRERAQAVECCHVRDGSSCHCVVVTAAIFRALIN